MWLSYVAKLTRSVVRCAADSTVAQVMYSLGPLMCVAGCLYFKPVNGAQSGCGDPILGVCGSKQGWCLLS
jgi:hypothetical protein